MLFEREKIIGHVVLTEDGDRPYFVHKIHPHFEASLAKSTRIYTFTIEVSEEDQVNEVHLASCRRMR